MVADSEGNDVSELSLKDSLLITVAKNDTTVSCHIAGRDATLSMKRFKSDLSVCPKLVFYVDVELMSKVPILYNYISISMQWNKQLKDVFYSMCVVEKISSGERFVLGTYLRTKCPRPIYAVAMRSCLTLQWSLLMNHLKLRKDYNFLPDIEIDFDEVVEGMVEYFHEQKLVYDSSKGPNKDEWGRPMVTDGYDPLVALDASAYAAAQGQRSKRNVTARTTPNYSDNSKPPAKKRSKAKKNGKKGTTQKKKVSTFMLT